MTGPNHLVGGVVFTGVFSSFFSLNIFEKPQYLAVTMFCALLADIDHKRGILGRTFSFTRLPQFIERRYGHRTITHSLIFYLSLGFIIALFESFLSINSNYTIIYFLAYGSHLVFDMMTVSGVPLFFPFKKNPCVLPANPDLRLRVKDLKSESIVFVCFLAIGLFCYPLMVQGFWTTYNRSFGTLEHLLREYSSAEDFLLVDYDFQRRGERKRGKAILLHSERSKAVLFDSNKVFLITADMKVNEVLPSHTGDKRREKQHYFYAISSDSLSKLTADKVIISADFQASKKVGYWQGANYHQSQIINLDYCFNPSFQVISDTNKTAELNALELKLIDLKEQRSKILEEKEEYKAILSELQTLNANFEGMRLSDQEKAVERLKTLRRRKEDFNYSHISTEKIEKQIEHLQEEINRHDEINYTGKLINFVGL